MNTYTNINPLHPPIADNYQSGFSALGYALTGMSDASLPSNWRRVPQDSSGRNVGHRHLQSPITFQMRGVKVMGVDVSDLIGRVPGETLRMLVGGHDIYLQQQAGSSFASGYTIHFSISTLVIADSRYSGPDISTTSSFPKS